MCRLCWRFCECVPAFSHPPPVSPSSTVRSSSSPQRTSELDPNTQTLTRQTGPLAFADSLNRRRKTNSCPNACGHGFFSSSACLRARLSLLCKVNPGVSLSCDVTLQPRSWDGEITTCLQVPLSVCARLGVRLCAGLQILTLNVLFVWLIAAKLVLRLTPEMVFLYSN